MVRYNDEGGPSRSTLGHRITIYLLIFLALFLAYGWLKLYFTGPELGVTTILKVKPKPVIVKETKYSERIPERVECIPVEIKVPDAKAIEELERKYSGNAIGLDLQRSVMLGEYTLPKMPYGGEALVTVEGEKPTLSVLPKKQPFFEWGSLREFGLGFGAGQNGYAWRAKYRQDLFRVGPVMMTGEAAVQGDEARSYWTALIEANIRF